MANSGLFSPIPLGTAVAPLTTIGEPLCRESGYRSYRAVLTRRLGALTAADFVINGQRLVSVCDEIYNGTEITLVAEQAVPMNETLVAASHDQYVGPEGITISTDELTMDNFRHWFDLARTMKLLVKPTAADDVMKGSFAVMEFTRQSRRRLFFYAQDGLQRRAARPSLTKRLTRKLFQVPSTAPSLNYKVQFGISAFLRTRDQHCKF